MIKSTALLIAVTMFAGCAGSNSMSPTAPSVIGNAQLAVAQETPVRLPGFILDTAFKPLSGARIEVISGPSIGTSVLSDADGLFTLTGMFNAATQFRATKEGHESRIQTWNCSVADCTTGAQPWLGFYLTVPEPTVDIAGVYTMTFDADSSCSDLPTIARSRSYRVSITAQPAANRSTIPGFDAEVVGAKMLGKLSGFPIGAAGNRLSVWMHGGHDPAIVEDMGGNSYLAFSGIADATVVGSDTSYITTAFDGWIEAVTLASPLIQWALPNHSTAHCDSRNHRITLMRES
jgi:hypothetical protein